MRRKIWKTVDIKDIPPDANIIGGRFILTLENFQTPQVTTKVRNISQGYSDFEKSFIVHDISALCPASIRLLLSVAAYRKLRLFSFDMTQAYLQSREPLSRKLYIRPKPDDRWVFSLKENEIFESEKPLYGFCNSGD